MKKDLAKKLAAYSGLTGAIMLAAQQSNSQIIYTDISDVRVNQNDHYYGLDLNNDGITDFGFDFTDIEGINSVGRAHCTGVNDCPQNSMLFPDYSTNSLKKLDFLQPIDASAFYWGKDVSYVRFLDYDNPGSQYGEWQGGVSGYAGLKLNLNGNSYYGWMRCRARKDASVLTIKDYAYNSVPGMPILAGDEGCSDSYEPNNYKQQATPIQTNTLIRAQVASATDNDWYSFSISGSDNNARITLTSLLFDCNIKLFDHNGNEMAKSVNKGAKDDTIVYNGLNSTNYYVKVYGRNGHFSNVDCYSLMVATSESPFRESLTLSSEENVTEFSVYPNPLSSSTAIQFSVSQSSPLKIELFDLEGRKIKTIAAGNFEMGEYEIILQRENLTPGVYFLKLFSDENVISGKLIVQ